jgi:pumilio RNA-binding family
MLSRKIQKVFEFGRDDQKELIFNKIERACMQFSKDIFGNYIVQKVIEKG